MAGLIGVWAGTMLGIVIAGLLRSSADADRDYFWQDVATVLSYWVWGAAHGLSQARHDEGPSDVLRRAMKHVDKTRGAS